jgi:hypothetical protein
MLSGLAFLDPQIPPITAVKGNPMAEECGLLAFLRFPVFEQMSL